MIESLKLFLPESVLILTALLAFAFIFMTRKHLYISLLIMSFAILLSSILSLSASGDIFYGTYRINLFSQWLKVLLSTALLFVVFISDSLKSIHHDDAPEYFLLLLSGTLGMMMLVSAVELLTLFVALELTSYSQYILVPLRRSKFKQAEAGMKYLLFGAAASALTLFGMSYLFASTQTTFLDGIFAHGESPAFLYRLFPYAERFYL